MDHKQLNIKQTVFNNERIAALGIELIHLSDLFHKLEKGAERVEFFMLLLITGGRGKHKVDFIEYELQKGSLLFVRPGQVQEWDDYCGLEGEVVLIDPHSLPHALPKKALLPLAGDDGLAFMRWQNVVALPDVLYRDLFDALLRLHRDFANFDGSKIDSALIRHELLSLLLRVMRWQDKVSPMVSAAGRSHNTYRLFIELLENEYVKQHSLNFYAHRLGYAQSTISRACLKFEGISAKAVIDKRIALEAKRFLVHSSASVAEVGFYLGFSEATNFIKFFRRVTGATPQAFRASRCS